MRAALRPSRSGTDASVCRLIGALRYFRIWLGEAGPRVKIATHSFAPFIWYHIAFGIAVLATSWRGLVIWSG